MADRRRFGIEGRKGVCTKGRRVEDRNNPVVSRHASSRTWRKVEDNRTGY